jgi:hypothetical protein
MGKFVKNLGDKIMSDKHRDYWSDCEQVYFLDGYGWGLTDKCQRICLGKEEDILKFFETGELNGNFHPKQKEVLNWILEYRKENYGESNNEPKKPSAVRSRPAGAVKRREAHTRQTKTRKRLPIHSAKR